MQKTRGNEWELIFIPFQTFLVFRYAHFTVILIETKQKKSFKNGEIGGTETKRTELGQNTSRSKTTQAK
jgi:hypothetical protein